MAFDLADRRQSTDRRSGTVDRRGRHDRRTALGASPRRAPDRRSHHDRRSAYPDRRLQVFDRRAFPELVTAPRRRWADGSEPLLPVIAIAVLSFLDVVTTERLADLGGAELNPVSEWLMDTGWLLTAKVLAVGTLAALVTRVRSTRWIPLALWCVVGVYAGVMAVHVWQLAR